MSGGNFSKKIEENKYRFFEFYYIELDKYLLEYESNEIIKTIDEEFQLYYESEEEFKGELNINIKKEPSKKSKKLVHQVFDNASRVDFGNVDLLIQHLNKYFRFLIFLKKTNTDVFELFTIRRINNLFLTAHKYNIILYYNLGSNNLINDIFELLKKHKIKLIASFLECLLHIVYHNINYIKTVEYERYIPIESSQDSNTSNNSNFNTLSSSYGSPPKFGSPLSNGINQPRYIEKPPIQSLSLLNQTSRKMYNMIIQFVFHNYQKLNFWMTKETYNTSLHILQLGLELDTETIDLIHETLNYFTKSTHLYNIHSISWNINIYLQNSLNTMKNMMLFSNSKKNNHNESNIIKDKTDLKWIFPLMESKIIKDYYQCLYLGNDIKKKQLIIVDGRNWFYSIQHENTNHLNISEIQKYRCNDDFIKSVFDKLQHQFTQFKTNITPTFTSIMKCIFVFNEYHRHIISQYNPDMLNMCVFTPQKQNTNNDDIFCLYLWLSNPGSFILSNDQYRIYADKLMGHQYYQGLWQHWIQCFKIGK